MESSTLSFKHIVLGIIIITLIVFVATLPQHPAPPDTGLVPTTPPPATAAQTEYQPVITIQTDTTAPLSGMVTLLGTGKNVYFEGSFPASLISSSGVVVWQGPATAQGDWMTSNPVPFILPIDTTTIPNGSYILILEKDDPSNGESGRPPYALRTPITISN